MNEDQPHSNVSPLEPGKVTEAPRAQTPSRGAPLRWWGVIALLFLPILDLVGGATVRSRVAPETDWESAAEFVRDSFEPEDLIVAAPDWTDSLVYEQLGDLVGLRGAGRSDDAAYGRVWSLSIRGHLPTEYEGRVPAEQRFFGRVLVSRWDLGESRLLYSFLDHLEDASVERVVGRSAQPCAYTRMPWGNSGLHWGAMFPARRFQCDRGQPHLFVGETVQTDLDIKPRHCIWQHPQGTDPIRATFSNVPLGDRLVFYGGIYYQHERVMQSGELQVQIRVGNDLLGGFTHQDGDGWKREEMRMPPGVPARGTVSVEVSSGSPHMRSFCWSAYTADGERGGE